MREFLGTEEMREFFGERERGGVKSEKRESLIIICGGEWLCCVVLCCVVLCCVGECVISVISVCPYKRGGAEQKKACLDYALRGGGRLRVSESNAKLA